MKAMGNLIFHMQKRYGCIKTRTCANRSTKREYTPKEGATSPTAATESTVLTEVIDEKQNRYVMTLYIPNVFVQTSVPQVKGEDKTIIATLAVDD